MAFKRTKSVTRPVLTHKTGVIQVLFQSGIFKAQDTGEGRSSKDANGNVMAPPDLAHVIDLATGEEKTLVINKVLGSELNRAYPDESYKGKAFEIEKFSPTGGKKYATYSIAEGEYTPDNAPATPAPAAPATPAKGAAKK